jgi:hypothetical protein
MFKSPSVDKSHRLLKSARAGGPHEPDAEQKREVLKAATVPASHIV